MNRRTFACVGVLAITLAGCTIGAATAAHSMGIIKLGADLSLSGDDAPDGVPARNAIDLAVKKAARVCGPSRHPDACFDLQVIAYDDVSNGIHDPAKGMKNVQLLADDAQVLAVVGPLYDSVARSEIPVANAVRLAIVSPATANECLTQEPPDGHCQGLAAKLRPKGPNNFFRAVTTQLLEGAAGADLAFKTLGKRRAFVINDQTAFGLAIANGFVARFGQDGGTIVDPTDLGAFDPSQTPSFGSRVARAVGLGADVIYFAGADIGSAASLRREMAARMPQVPLVGSDRLSSSQFAKAAGASARGAYYTVVGSYAQSLRSAQGFIGDYKKLYNQDPGTYSLAAFDSTNLLIAAIARAIDDAGGKLPTRDQVLHEVSLTRDYRGAMGSISFDSRGDIGLKLITGYQWIAATDPVGRFTAQLAIEN